MFWRKKKHRIKYTDIFDAEAFKKSVKEMVETIKKYHLMKTYIVNYNGEHYEITGRLIINPDGSAIIDNGVNNLSNVILSRIPTGSLVILKREVEKDYAEGGIVSGKGPEYIINKERCPIFTKVTCNDKDGNEIECIMPKKENSNSQWISFLCFIKNQLELGKFGLANDKDKAIYFCDRLLSHFNMLK